MINNNPASVARRLTNIFLRKGGEGKYTKLFNNLEPETATLLLCPAPILQDAIPVVGGYKDPGEWLLITTGSMIWHSDGMRTELASKEIRHATVDFDKMAVRRL